MKIKVEVSLRKNGSYSITVTRGKEMRRAWSKYNDIGRISGGLIASFVKPELRSTRYDFKKKYPFSHKEEF